MYKLKSLPKIIEEPLLVQNKTELEKYKDKLEEPSKSIKISQSLTMSEWFMFIMNAGSFKRLKATYELSNTELAQRATHEYALYKAKNYARSKGYDVAVVTKESFKGWPLLYTKLEFELYKKKDRFEPLEPGKIRIHLPSRGELQNIIKGINR